MVFEHYDVQSDMKKLKLITSFNLKKIDNMIEIKLTRKLWEVTGS